MKKLLLLVAILIILVSLPFVAGAFVGTETYQQAVLIKKDQVIDDNFVRFADTIDIEGKIIKDVIVVGGNLNIKGEVEGDILAAGGNIKITGPVKGNVRVAGGMVEIDGPVGKNVNAFGGVVTIGENAKIGWNLVLGGGQVEVKGKVGGRVDGWAGQIILASEIEQDVNLKIGRDGQLILNPEAHLGGNLEYWAAKEATIKEGAEIFGQTAFHFLASSTKKVWGISRIFGKIVSLFGLLVVGLVLVSVLHRFVLLVDSIIISKPWTSLGWGVVYFIIAPVILVLLVFTVIGSPLALIGIGIYLISLYLSKVFIGLVIGVELIWRLNKKKKIKTLIWPMVLGTTIFVIFTSLPYVGWIILLLGIWLALGGMIQIIRGLLVESPPKTK